MARKKKEDIEISNNTTENSQSSSADLVNDLISGSSFKFVTSENSTNGSLTDKPYVPTPVLALNDILGGGLPLGSIVEVFGPNAGGKSSMLYETLGNFQKKFQNGVAFILDTESSTDESRLRQLGVDPMRAPRTGASTLEDGFEQILNILKKMTEDKRYSGFPVMIMWDTIATSGIKTQIEEGADYNRMVAMERARILKYNLTKLFPYIEKLNVLIVLLNQATVDMSGFKPGITSAGGNALLHDIHIRIKIDGGTTDYDGVFAQTKHSRLSLLKSKASPLINNIPLIIDITKGGIISKGDSLIEWFDNLPVFNKGAWYSVNKDYYNKYKPYWDKFGGFESNFRKGYINELADSNPLFTEFLELIWTDMICERYTLQAIVCTKKRNELIADLWKGLGLTEKDFSLELTDISPENINAENLNSFQDNVEELSEILKVGIDKNSEEV